MPDTWRCGSDWITKIELEVKMKKQRDTLVSLLLTVFVVLFIQGNLLSAETGESIYGHISYVDNDASVIREDKTEHKAVVNLPVAPGDQIVTSEKGRCELQFDNGTIIRLDKDSRLKVTTVLAPSLTSRWKITTLHLMRGGLYSMNTNYNSEMFQIITPNAAFDLKKRATAFIRLKDSGDTIVFARRGKFKVMYGEDIDSLKTETIRADKGYTITADHHMRIDEGKRDVDFVGWNEYINRNFKDLHFGISKVPKKIYRYGKGLVYWAEKWSSLFGEWVYDDIFGYVWKPADEYFAWASRPFFHANFTYVNGQMFIVPQQPWGWAPAHMGTWVWMKWGWTWVPGNAFSPGICSGTSWGFFDSWFLPYSLTDWMYYGYGGYDLYYVYRNYGIRAWRTQYQGKFNTYKKAPGVNKFPKAIRELIGKLNRAPVEVVKERLGTETRPTMMGMKKVEPLLKSVEPAVNVNTNRKSASPSIRVSSHKIQGANIISRGVTPGAKESKESKLRAIDKGRGDGVRAPLQGFRDWNPDSRWAASNGYNIAYSSKNNEVVCPDLGLTSKTLSYAQRAALRGTSFSMRGLSSTQSGSSSSGSNSSSSTSSSSSFASSRGGGPDAGSHGGGHASKK
jgi:hypothetical protein